MSSREDADGQAMGFRNSEDFAIYLASTKERRPITAQPVQPADHITDVGNMVQSVHPTLSDAQASLVWATARDKWNAHADVYNWWEHLGGDEMSLLIIREAEFQLAAIAQPVQPATMREPAETGLFTRQMQDYDCGLGKWLAAPPTKPE